MPQQTIGGYDLQRFVLAQQPVYATALSQLKAGQKKTHWIWFVFPQVDGLGHSAMSQRYAIKSKDEAVAYLGHPLLGTRLAECTRAVLDVGDRTAHEIFGSPDELKFRSSMTLFEGINAGGGPYRKALDRFFGGERDPATLAVLGRWPEAEGKS
jgi:uncharacterized protein (DUF1810 family)